MSLTFRRMTPADLDAVLAIEYAVYDFPWSRGNFDDSLKSGYSCWVAEQDGRLAGYCVIMLVVDEAHLLNISISKPLQGRGLGRELLQFVQSASRGHGANTLFLEVRESNTAARRLYDSAGFNEMALRRNYYPAAGGREHAVLMGLSL